MYFATKIKKNSAKSKDFTEFWSEWGDSNSRHPAPKAGALPTALHPDMKLWDCPGVSSQITCATNCATPGYSVLRGIPVERFCCVPRFKERFGCGFHGNDEGLHVGKSAHPIDCIIPCGEEKSKFFVSPGTLAGRCRWRRCLLRKLAEMGLTGGVTACMLKRDGRRKGR